MVCDGVMCVMVWYCVMMCVCNGLIQDQLEYTALEVVSEILFSYPTLTFVLPVCLQLIQISGAVYSTWSLIHMRMVSTLMHKHWNWSGHIGPIFRILA